MESKVKILGHPAHQILIVFPLGLLASSVGFDAAYKATGKPEFETVAFWTIGAGVPCGLLAAVFGAVDWFAIPQHTRAKTIGLWHAGGNVGVLLLFSASGWLRSKAAAYIAPAAALTLSCFGVALGFLSGWLGGELVDRLGVGVDDGAHLNAPSSLSGRPAVERAIG
jgi:uncharacterized membrane protein